MANEADFWAAAASGAEKKGDPSTVLACRLDAVEEALRRMNPADVIAFKIWLETQMDRAYTWDLWNAAYLMMGGCSDDMFEYFRAWLIAQGQETFDRVLTDPETLADLDIEDPVAECEFELLLYAPADVYEELTGEDLYEKLPAMDAPAEPRGEPFDEENAAARFPRIAKRWG